MSHAISYTGPERAYRAMNDTNGWLTARQREAIKALAFSWSKEGEPAHRCYANVRTALELFAGVSGFPARVYAFHVVYGHVPRVK